MTKKLKHVAAWIVPACCVAMAPGAWAQSGTAPPAAPAAASDEQAAFAAADAGYRALEQGRAEEAVGHAQRAVQLAPRNVSYARLLMFASSAAGRSAQAEQAATAVLAAAPDDALALAERARLRAARGDAAGSRTDYEAALRAPGLAPAQRVTVLAELGRTQEARDAFTQLPASGPNEVERAYLASRLDLHQDALAAFRRADAASRLPASALRDAGYAASRAGDDAQAVTWFKRAIDAGREGRLALTPQETLETRRSVTELSRRWGVFASLNYRGGGGITPGFGAAPGVPVEEAWQAGAEAWWRPFGQNNGRYMEVFARTFETLDTATGPTGSQSRQIGLGARVKPFTTQNLVLSISRTDTRTAPADWLLQAGYSADWGTDVRLDRDTWPTTRLAAEAGRYVEREQRYAVASVQSGVSVPLSRTDHPSILFPHAVLAGEYDSTAVRRTSVSAGAGVTWRQWFRGDAYAAARSYTDVTVQYRGHVGGDERTQGWFATVLLAF